MKWRIVYILLIILYSLLFSQNEKELSELNKYIDSSKYYANKYQYLISLEWSQKAFVEAKKTVADTNALYIQTLDLLAKNYSQCTKHSEGMPYAQRLFELTQKVYGDKSEEYALSLGVMASYYIGMADYKQSEKLLLKAQDIIIDFNPDKLSALTKIYDYLSNLYINIQKYQEAREVLKKKILIYKEINGTKESISIANTLNSLGYAYHVEGELVLAEQYKIEALDMYDRLKMGDNTYHAVALLSLSYLYFDEGRYEEARSLVQDALDMLKRAYQDNHQEIAFAYLSLAQSFFYQHKYDEAEKYFYIAKDMLEKIFGYEHRYLIRIYETLGNINFNKNQFTDAEGFYQKVIKLDLKLFDKQTANSGRAFDRLAELYYYLGDYATSDTFAFKSVAIFEEMFGSNSYKLASPYLAIANNAYALDNIDKAEHYFNLQFDLLKKYFTHNSIILSEIEKLHFLDVIKSNLIDFNFFAVNESKSNPELLTQLYENNLLYKGILFNSGRLIKRRIFNSNDTLLIELYNEWVKQKNTISSYYSMSDEELSDLSIDINSLESEINQMEKSISLKSEDFKNSIDNSTIDIKKVKSSLANNEAIVEIIRLEPNDMHKKDSLIYIALIINNQSNTPPELVVLSNAKELESSYFKNYINSIKFKQIDKFSYDAYWKKIAYKLKIMDIEKIFISADGIYNKISIPSLYNTHSNNYVINEISCQNIINANDLLPTISNKIPNNNVILFGNPKFEYHNSKNDTTSEVNQEREITINTLSDNTSRSLNKITQNYQITQLPDSEIEIEQIAEILKDKYSVQSFTNEMATEEEIKKTNHPYILHIATHGLFLEDFNSNTIDKENNFKENPLFRSMLLFAGASNSINNNRFDMTKEDGLLTAYESQNLNLEGTDLVVLSACETGIGEIKNGEGVYGLQRAFRLAGAKNILMSLWKVDDSATKILMINFYKNLIKFNDKNKALKMAQQQMIESENYSHPYYWGAFILFGE